MIGVCTRCGTAFETTLEDAYTPGVLCVACYRAEHSPALDLLKRRLCRECGNVFEVSPGNTDETCLACATMHTVTTNTPQGTPVELTGELRRSEDGRGYREWVEHTFRRIVRHGDDETLETITRRGVYLGWTTLACGYYDPGGYSGAPWDGLEYGNEYNPPSLSANKWLRAAVVLPVYPGGRYHKPIYCAYTQLRPVAPDADLPLFSVSIYR